MNAPDTRAYADLLRDSERSIDHAVLNRLDEARSVALQAAPWYRSLALWVPASAVALSAFLLVLPAGEPTSLAAVERAPSMDENLQLMIDGPEFYLWASRQVAAIET